MSKLDPVNDTFDTIIDITPKLRDAALSALFSCARLYLGFAPKNVEAGFALGYAKSYANEREKQALYDEYGSTYIIADNACRRVRRHGKTVYIPVRHELPYAKGDNQSGSLLVVNPFKVNATSQWSFNQYLWDALQENGWSSSDYSYYQQVCSPRYLVNLFFEEHWTALVEYARSNDFFFYRAFMEFTQEMRAA